MHNNSIKIRNKGKIPSHFGIRDYYKFFKKENPELNIDYKRFVKIITEFNEGIKNLIIDDNLEYTIPYLGSTISIKKTKATPKIIDGKLYNPSPVDWVATNKLWNEDQEAKDKKLLVRYLNSHTSKHVFRIHFKKYKYPFSNKQLYKFKPSRIFQRALASRIKDEDKSRYDAYLIYQSNEDK